MEKNKIYLGDAYELINKIPDKSVDLIYTDIPYLFESGGSGGSALSKRIEKTKVELADISNGINYSIFDEFCRVLKNIYIYMV